MTLPRRLADLPARDPRPEPDDRGEQGLAAALGRMAIGTPEAARTPLPPAPLSPLPDPLPGDSLSTRRSSTDGEDRGARRLSPSDVSTLPVTSGTPGWTRRRPARTGTAAGGDDGVDWGLVVRLRREASERISRERADHRERFGTDLEAEDLRLLGDAVIRQVVHDHAERLTTTGEALWSLEIEMRHVRVVADAIFGYGRLQPLFEIPDAENIEINGCDRVLVQFPDGHRETQPPVADSDQELVEAIRFLGESASPPRPFDDAHPTITVALGDRYRLHAIGFGLAHRPSIVIRHHTLTEITLDDLAAGGMMPRQVAVLLRAAVRARRSIVISGDQGAGKTTLLRALVDAIPPTERFGTLETDYELLTHLHAEQRNMIALQATVGLGEQVDGRTLGEYTVADLVPEALRQNLSRLVIGEVRGSEAGAMFEAMQTGAGTLSTTHSHSASSTMDRLAARVAQGGVLTMEEAYRQIAHNITLLVHVVLVDDTWRQGTRRRFISEIRQLTGAVEEGRPITHLTYSAPGLRGSQGSLGGIGGTVGVSSAAVFHPDPELLAELAVVEPEIGGWA
ncbi:MAG: CpaF/VirB11 family protein [Acidipropionibacterium jensenii]|nr:CpaF/VirB11 family protein [Acidipropionibacterium jensenii]MDN6481210.1 CpaF/VirB11 family protein [Acidipropionibacterium jensenii]